MYIYTCAQKLENKTMKKFFTLFAVAMMAMTSTWAQNKEKGHEYVDLGLSVMWATCNVGAEDAFGYGSYYQWGAVETFYSAIGDYTALGDKYDLTMKDGYSEGYVESTYKYMDHSINTYKGYTKYTFADNQTNAVWYDSEGKFIGDDLRELEDVDDVAIQEWGGKWRMPTYDELKELCNGCYWVWTNSYKDKGVNGYVVYKAKKDSEKGVIVYAGSKASSDYNIEEDVHIFLPASGDILRAELTSVNSYGTYWTRTLYKHYANFAWTIGFNNSSSGLYNYHRYKGYAVRPVCKIDGATPTAIGEVKADGVKTRKVVKNGQLVIEKEGKSFDLSGREVK